MSEEKIDKAILGAVSNLNIENMNPTKEELELIKEALKNNSHMDSLLYKVLQLIEKKKEEKLNGKTKNKDR